MSHPSVSLVVPVFNGARYLREALDSLVGQTYRPLEILVMDDASTDETP
jgi:glycosyltransferase involved in cell wall biosynthesis